MIFLKDKLIYIKIPKTGSTSIANSLLDKYDMSISSLANGSNPNGVININSIIRPNSKFYGWHATYGEISSYLKDISNFSIFTILREPIKRIHSVYKWQKIKYSENDSEGIFENFDSFISAFRLQNKNLSKQAYLHLEPQSYWVKGMEAYSSNRKSFILNQSNKAPNVRFFKIEDLSDKMDEIESYTGFSLKKRHNNKSKIIEEISLNKENTNFIKEFYFKDFQLIDQLWPS